jgi:hypothetical protein
MKKLILLFIAVICSVFSAAAQFTSVMISNVNDPEEISICINPKNPNQVVAGANLNNVYYSIDTGATWTIGTLTEPTLGVWGDPIIFTDTAGVFYYSHLANPPSGSWIDRIVFQKSTNGGATWSAGTATGLNGTKAQDKEAVIVNQQTNEIYVTWTQFDVYGSSDPSDSSLILFSKSADAGATWSTPVRLSMDAGNCIDSDSTVEGAIPVIGPAGEIFVVWSGPDGLVYNKSLDNGVTWLPHEVLITSTPGGWDYNIAGLQRCNGLPQAVCDLSGGPNHGTIYINWTDQRNGSTDTDVWLIKSTDGGDTWSSPVRVNDDPPGRQQFLTWMDIDETNGNLYFVFYDRRNFTPPSQKTDVYLAKSSDGGNTFSNFKINSNFFTPSPAIFFGDYVGISAYNDIVRPAWMQYASGTLSVWTALVDGFSVNVDEHAVNAYSPVLEQNSPNPFSENTWIKFSLEKPGVVNLFVYDLLGNKVASLYENEKFKEGNFDYIFNAVNYSLPAGIYYYSLTYDENTVTKKMIIY